MNRKSLGLGLMLAAVLLALAALPQPAARAVTDTTPPTGTITINNDDWSTTSPNVTIAMTWADNAGGSGVARMRFSNDGANWTAWESLTPSRSYTLPGGDGYNTVRVQFLDKANNRSIMYYDVIRLDTKAPTGTIVINDDKSCTNSRNVTVGLTYADDAGGTGVVRMRFSNDGSTWTAYEGLTPSRSYQLPAGDGYKTVRVQFLDLANNRSATYSDYIRLDTAAPTGTITINKGDLTTPKQPVTLGLTWADGTGSGVVRMRFSDNGSTWTNWMYPTATKAHRLPNPELGYQTVRVQYLDGANNYSPVYNDFIKLVEDPNDETVLLPGDVPLVMKWVPAGSFAMGSLDTDPNAESSEMPRHTVTLSGFWMGKYEVTNAQMKALTGTDPCMACLYTNGEANAPAVNLSWDDAKSFVTALSSYTGKTFRLPSEAQFQYALAAGTTTQFYWGDDSNGDGVGQYAWWYQNTYSLGDYYVQPVGHKLPNAWGLHDMVGNALEWCEDDWHDTYAGAPTNGSAWVDSPRADKRACHDYGITAYFKQVRTAARAVYTATNADWVSGMRVVRIP